MPHSFQSTCWMTIRSQSALRHLLHSPPLHEFFASGRSFVPKRTPAVGSSAAGTPVFVSAFVPVLFFRNGCCYCSQRTSNVLLGTVVHFHPFVLLMPATNFLPAGRQGMPGSVCLHIPMSFPPSLPSALAAGRSQMSVALFNAHVDPEKARGISAGTQPGGAVHPVCVTVMKELGIDIENNQPQRLTQELAQQASLLVTMGCGEACPYVPGALQLHREASVGKSSRGSGATAPASLNSCRTS